MNDLKGDLQSMYMKAGVKDEGVLLLFQYWILCVGVCFLTIMFWTFALHFHYSFVQL